MERGAQSITRGNRRTCSPATQLGNSLLLRGRVGPSPGAAPRRARARSIGYASSDMERLVWTPREVVDVDGPRAMLRAYLEQRDIREFCASVSLTARIEAACDVGCGFGRLTPVLTEFAERVVGFEREAGLLTVAQSLQPSIEFRAVETLSSLPAEDASFAFALVFTVLQHIPEPEVHTVIAELQRLLAPGGHLLLCEETDATLEAGDR